MTLLSLSTVAIGPVESSETLVCFGKQINTHDLDSKKYFHCQCTGIAET